MSTTCVFPLSTEQSFRLAKLSGYDGIEVMVTNEETTQDADALLALAEKYDLPVMSIHAPVLLLTEFVWGRDPQVKLEKSAELAKAVGAPSVIVHPPFRWQKGYAKDFLAIVRQTALAYDVEIAVENMFPWAFKGRSMQMYYPGWDPTLMDCDAMTLDFSHASLSGRDSLEMAMTMGERLRHIHLCDGSGSQAEGRVLDEHLTPGYGTEPVAEVLEMLAAQNWTGQVVAEVNTRKAHSEQGRLDILRETLDFAKAKLGAEAFTGESVGSTKTYSHLVWRTLGSLMPGASARDARAR